VSPSPSGALMAPRGLVSEWESSCRPSSAEMIWALAHSNGFCAIERSLSFE
jgi:hypothetical protein